MTEELEIKVDETKIKDNVYYVREYPIQPSLISLSLIINTGSFYQFYPLFPVDYSKYASFSNK